MSTNLFLDDVARESLERQAGGAELGWLLPELLGLLEQGHDQPTERFAPIIRRRICERAFVDEHGDTMVEPHRISDVEAQTQSALRVMEAVRAAAIRAGHWSDAPMTQLMCG